jgi:hypothetical protein
MRIAPGGGDRVLFHSTKISSHSPAAAEHEEMREKLRSAANYNFETFAACDRTANCSKRLSNCVKNR